MKLINNYLDSLETYLPDEMKQEVREELEASIYGEVEDKQEQLGRDLNDKEQEDILQKIGHPMKVASSYLPHQELISRDYYPAFKRSLEITLIIVLGINLLFSLPDFFTDTSFIRKTIQLSMQLLNAGLFAMAIVVVVFYSMERSGVKLDDIYAWSAKDINALKPKLSINRVEVFFEMLVEIIFLAWWNDLLSIPDSLEEKGIVLNYHMSPEWSEVHWSVNIIIGLSVALSFYKIAIAGWNKPTLTFNILLNLASLVVLYQIFQFENYYIVEQSISSNANWLKLMDNLEWGILSVLAFITVYVIWEIYSDVTKLIRNR